MVQLSIKIPLTQNCKIMETPKTRRYFSSEKKKNSILKCPGKFIFPILISFVSIKLVHAAAPPPPAGKQWQAVSILSDNFDGNTLNTAKWQPDHPYWNGRLPSQFNPNNVSVRNGMLRLKSRSLVQNLNNVNDPDNDHWVDSSCVTSRGRSFKVGMYSEARMKMSNMSMTSSFWMQGQGIEIDVIENFGQPSNPRWFHLDSIMHMNTHRFVNGEDLSTPEFHNMGRRGADSFNTYGVWWKDASTVWMYFNGVKVEEITTAQPFNADMFMFFDTEVFNWGVGLPLISDLNNNNKNVAFVDSVKTYRLVNASTGGGGSLLPIGATVALKGNNNRWVSGENGNAPMTCNRNNPAGWERLTVVNAGGGKVALKNTRGLYVSSANGSSAMVADRPAIGGWEKFTVVNAGGGKFALKGNNGKYVSSNNGLNNMTCDRNSIGGWEKFTSQTQ